MKNQFFWLSCVVSTAGNFSLTWDFESFLQSFFCEKISFLSFSRKMFKKWSRMEFFNIWSPLNSLNESSHSNGGKNWVNWSSVHFMLIKRDQKWLLYCFALRLFSFNCGICFALSLFYFWFLEIAKYRTLIIVLLQSI